MEWSFDVVAGVHLALLPVRRRERPCAGSYVLALRISPVSGRKFAPHAITGVHDRSASRISGRTRAAVCATYVSALRIAVLKECGQSPAIISANLSAEKTWRVKLFRSRAQNLQLSKRRYGRPCSKISAGHQLRRAVRIREAGLRPPRVPKNNKAPDMPGPCCRRDGRDQYPATTGPALNR
jgi:predicted ABC-class ATPase